MNLRETNIRRFVKPALAVLAVVLLARCVLVPAGLPTPRENARTEQVSIADWAQMDEPLRLAFIQAEKRALNYAREELRSWTVDLKQRAEEDFFPWYFSYWNQQALTLKAFGWHLMSTPPAQGFLGRQPPAEERMAALIEEAFLTRVLQPANAQLKIDALTRETVRVYLHTLSEEMEARQAVYGVRTQEWQRYIGGVAGMLQAIEGNRQVPVILKGLTAGSSVATAKIIQSAVVHIKQFAARRYAGEMMQQGMVYGSRQAGRGYGWLAFTAVSVWDIYDHHRTVSQNLPVMRRLVYGCLEQVEEQVMSDPKCGIVRTLEDVRRGVIKNGRGER